ncbi:MAG: hypothetical protein Kow0090_03530 [Myxococcota bacterium]
MKRETRNLLTTAIAIVILFGLIVLALKDVEKKEELEKAEERAKLVFPEMGEEAVLKMKFFAPHKMVELERENKQAKWRVTSPIKTRANQDVAETTESFSRTLAANKTIKEANLDYRKYNLGDSYPRIEFTLASGKTIDFMIGDKNEFDNTYFARRMDRKDEVFFISQTAMEKYLKELNDLRQQTLFDKITQDELETVEIQVEKEIYRLEKKGGKEGNGEKVWNLTAPISVPADKSAVNQLVSALNGISANRFLTPEEEKNTSLHKLDAPAITITVTKTDGSKQTVDISVVEKQKEKKEEGEPEKEFIYYGKTRGYDEIADLKLPEVNKIRRWKTFDYRDKQILKFPKEAVANVLVNYEEIAFEAKRDVGAEKPNETWVFINPDYGKAKGYKFNSLLISLENLKATRFVDEEAKNLKQYGLDPVQGELVLKDKNNAELEHLYIGAKAQDGVYVTSKNKDIVYMIKEEEIKKFALDPKDAAETPPKEEKTSVKAEEPPAEPAKQEPSPPNP